MKIKQITLLVALTIYFVTTCHSQHRTYAITNGFGIMGGVTQFNIETDNFITIKGDGYMGGMIAVVDIPHKWYNISYGMQLAENYLDISGRATANGQGSEMIEYKVFTAQVALLMHIKPINNYLTIDLGPMFQYNGKLDIKDKTQENYFINNYDNLYAKDITNISQFNFNGAVGASAGLKNFKLKAQYIYGFTNIFKKLNRQNINTSGADTDFKGNQSMLAFTAMFIF